MKKRFLRILSSLHVVVMIVGSAPLSGFVGLDLPNWADLLTLKADAVTYSGKCGDNLTWSFDADTGVLSIDGTGDMYNWTSTSNTPWYSYCPSIKTVVIGDSVTSIGRSAFNGCYRLTSVIIGNSVTSIGEYAFYSCDSLTSVTIPDSITSIGEYAFYYCDRLTSVTIGDSVTSIGEDAFYRCDSLASITVKESNPNYSSDEYGVLFNKDKTELIQYPVGNTRTLYTIPNSVTSIGVYAFRYCISLTSVTIPDSVTSIGDGAFFGCDRLTSVIIGDSVTSIGEYAFYYCTSLTSVTIPDSVTSIGEYAFYSCDRLTSVTIGNSVTSIGERAFRYCTSLTSVTVDSKNGYYSSDSYGVLYNKDKTNLIQYPIGNSRTSFTILDSVTNIGTYAFYYCTSLTSVTIPDSVTNIGNNAFYRCTSLTSVTIPDSVKRIGNDAFGYCISLTGITIPGRVTSIGKYAFEYCTSLTSVTIPDSVTSIGHKAFSSCTSLKSITVDSNNGYYSSDSYGVLYNKDKTKLIQYPVGNSRTSFTIPDSVTNIDDWAFWACDSLISVTIGNSVTKIYNFAFDDCTGLTDVYYTGSEEDWKKISIGTFNDALLNATIHYSLHSSYTSYITSATCETDGESYKICNDCGEKFDVTLIPMLGHNIDEWIVVEEPDCLSIGIKRGKCTRCQFEETREVPALEHVWGEWVVTTYPSFDADGEMTSTCENCGETKTQAIGKLDFRMDRIHATIDGNNITFKSCVNANNIAFGTTTYAGEEIVVDTAGTGIGKTSKGDRYQYTYTAWEADGKECKTTMAIGGITYNLTIEFENRELENTDVIAETSRTSVNVDNENKVITIMAQMNTDVASFRVASSECKEFVFAITEDENVSLEDGKYTITSNGAEVVEKTVTVNKGRYCEEEYTLRVIYKDYDVTSELTPVRGTIIYQADGVIRVKMRAGAISTGIRKTTNSGYAIDLEDVYGVLNGTSRPDAYQAYVAESQTNLLATMVITDNDGAQAEYTIIFDIGLGDPDPSAVDPKIELIPYWSKLSVDGETVKLTMQSGKVRVGVADVTKSGYSVEITDIKGKVTKDLLGRYIAYKSNNTADPTGRMIITTEDGKVYEYTVIFDMGLGEGSNEFNVIDELVTSWGTDKFDGEDVIIDLQAGKARIGLKTTTESGYKVELKDVNGNFVESNGLYIAYKSKNTFDPTATLVITLEDGTTKEYKVTFNLGLGDKS